MTNRRHGFLALLVRKPEKKSNWRNTKFALSCSVQKPNQTLAFRHPKKFASSIYHKMDGVFK